MPKQQICHLPYRFVNGHQRCRRCGEVLEIDLKLAYGTGFWVCRNEDHTEGEFVGPAAAFHAHQRKCEERPWLDAKGHVAGPSGIYSQPCARCGEDLGWLFFSEPLQVGVECTIVIEGRPGEDVKHSGSLSLDPGTPLCA
jgi:hypothetical protein